MSPVSSSTDAQGRVHIKIEDKRHLHSVRLFFTLGAVYEMLETERKTPTGKLPGFSYAAALVEAEYAKAKANVLVLNVPLAARAGVDLANYGMALMDSGAEELVCVPHDLLGDPEEIDGVK